VPRLPPVIADLAERLDARVMDSWFAAVSVPTRRTRAWLRGRRLRFVDPDATERPSLRELDATADAVIARYATSAALVGGAAGLGGMASIPPELMAQVVAALRLAQRLCVVYGFDPETDRGQMALWRALAAGYEVELPAAGPVGLRASQVPGLLLRRQSNVGGSLARSVVKATAFRLLRFTRLVPVLASATGASAGRRTLTDMGARMSVTLSRLADVPSATASGGRLLVEDAIELSE